MHFLPSFIKIGSVVSKLRSMSTYLCTNKKYFLIKHLPGARTDIFFEGHAYAAAAVTAVGTAGSVYTFYKFYQILTRTKLPQKWTQVGTLSNLYIFPVKSCGSIVLDKAECTVLGLRVSTWLRDRILMIMDDKNLFKTARQFPELVTVVPSVKGSVLTLKHKDMDTLCVNLAEVAETSKLEWSEVWSAPVPVYDCGREASEWFSKLLNKYGGKYKLALYASEKSRHLPSKLASHKFYKFTVKDTGAFPDDTSYHLINEASIEDLNTRLKESPVSHRFFRPNFVLKGGKPFEEDNWKFVKIGENIFEIVKPCTRCGLTTIDPDTGIRSTKGEPLSTLKSYRQIIEPELRRMEGDTPRMGLQMALRSGPGGFVNLNDPIYAA